MHFLIPFSILGLHIRLSNAAVQVTVPATPSSKNEVHSNFLGISFELSFITDYFGNDTQHISTPMLNYLANIKARTGNNPIRIRIGGNSADTSPYVDTPSSPMVQLENGTFNSNDQLVTYNPLLWTVMASVAQSVNGVSFVINAPLSVAPNASIANDMRNTLGSSLDSMLLGNEPDLYALHKERPGNYTVTDYFGDYTSALKVVGPDDSSGNAFIGGPSICCSLTSDWELLAVLQAGYLGNFSSALKYIAVQHYPQDNCQPQDVRYQLPWYMQHSNAVTLAQWQKPGIDYLLSQPNHPQLINSEFNSASCGGVPFSPSFGVGSMWSIDYALQMAVVGYSQAYIHTREAGISYNVLTPPAGPPGSAGAWSTNSPYYSLLVMAEGLRTDHGAYVDDLNLGNSATDANATSSAYAVYNIGNSSVSRLIIFNYANSSQEFALPASVFSSSGTALVKFLSAATPEEETNISWGKFHSGGQTWSGSQVTDGLNPVTPSWATPNQNLTGCATNGCTFTAPGPSLAMVFLDDAQYTMATITTQSPVIANSTNGASSTNSTTGTPSGTPKGASGALGLNAPWTTAFGALFTAMTFFAF